MKKIFTALFVLGLLLGCAGSTLLTWFLYQMQHQSAISFDIGRRSLAQAKKQADLTPDPQVGLDMTYESFEKLKSEQYNQRWLAHWDRIAQKIAQKLSHQGKVLVAMSEQGLREVNFKKKEIARGKKLSRDLLAVQKQSLVLAKEMLALSKKLLPISEALPKLIP